MTTSIWTPRALRSRVASLIPRDAASLPDQAAVSSCGERVICTALPGRLHWRHTGGRRAEARYGGADPRVR
ncbi:hypothetical protein RI103_04945 [Paraburkholderia sp. FT54]|uniref:hypothetical protein n=1 Tax=Paraburkholderia sp. FT54 TaxID=3074437 RepID=UPI002877D099|nr:hypothetical protein [Paraburkholderia sp. FT54]WNC90711.1 hypothetical protein RI103_04945 [Paraburkholderia sp. FT54]